MNYTHPVLDFIDRTKQIIGQYDKYKRTLPGDEQYEVTLLINCLIGLLVVPQQVATREPYCSYMQGWLTDQTIGENGKEWNIKPHFIRCAGYSNHNELITDPESMTIRQLIRSMRNTVTHYNFTLLPQGYSQSITQIHTIAFSELSNGKPRENGFRMELPVYALKQFSLRLADETREIISDALQNA